MIRIIKVSQDVLVKVAKSAKRSGLFFNAEQVKRTDGEYRVFKGLLGGVMKHTNGVGLAFNPDKKGLIVVWEANGDGGKYSYRMLNEEGLKAVVFKKVRYETIA